MRSAFLQALLLHRTSCSIQSLLSWISENSALRSSLLTQDNLKSEDLDSIFVGHDPRILQEELDDSSDSQTSSLNISEDSSSIPVSFRLIHVIAGATLLFLLVVLAAVGIVLFFNH